MYSIKVGTLRGGSSTCVWDGERGAIGGLPDGDMGPWGHGRRGQYLPYNTPIPILDPSFSVMTMR